MYKKLCVMFLCLLVTKGINSNAQTLIDYADKTYDVKLMYLVPSPHISSAKKVNANQDSKWYWLIINRVQLEMKMYFAASEKLIVLEKSKPIELGDKGKQLILGNKNGELEISDKNHQKSVNLSSIFQELLNRNDYDFWTKYQKLIVQRIANKYAKDFRMQAHLLIKLDQLRKRTFCNVDHIDMTCKDTDYILCSSDSHTIYIVSLILKEKTPIKVRVREINLHPALFNQIQETFESI